MANPLSLRGKVRAIEKSSLLPVILTLSLPKGKNPILGTGTLRFAQGDNLPSFAIVLEEKSRAFPKSLSRCLSF